MTGAYSELEGKHIILGVTGSIAAYKAASLASMLIKKKARVTVIMTKNAVNFINPITFETLTGEKCLTDTFDRNFSYSVEHVSLAKSADAFLIAPASADIIAKTANGLADDMLTTTFLACGCPKLVSPAMNTAMFKNPVTQDNMRKLSEYGVEVIAPASGRLACGDTGEGKMPEPDTLLCYLERAVTQKDMAGVSLLVTAGPTRESLDPVRFLSNRSSGKMGYAIAERAAYRGASVTLVSGPTALNAPLFAERISVESASQMAESVISRAEAQDIIIKAAAVADYAPLTVAQEKIKKKDDDLSIPLKRTQDILGYLGEHRRNGQFLCGFSMETENMLENSRAKLSKKHIDLIVANNVKEAGAGFATDTNIVTLISDSETIQLPLLSKEEVADELLSYIMKRRSV